MPTGVDPVARPSTAARPSWRRARMISAMRLATSAATSSYVSVTTTGRRSGLSRVMGRSVAKRGVLAWRSMAPGSSLSGRSAGQHLMQGRADGVLHPRRYRGVPPRDACPERRAESGAGGGTAGAGGDVFLETGAGIGVEFPLEESAEHPHDVRTIRRRTRAIPIDVRSKPL